MAKNPPNPDAKKDAAQMAAGKPDTGDKGEPKKVDMAEEAHWRLDDHARQIDELRKTLDLSLKAAEGVAPALMALMAHEVDKKVSAAIDAYAKKDRAEDRQMIVEIVKQMLADHDKTEGEVEVRKVGKVETPQGTHHIDVTETHRRKPK
jgi:hypothetical protein